MLFRSKANEFVFIKGPTFENMDYLAGLGFRITWTNWIGHPAHVNSEMLKRILDKTGLEYHIFFAYTIVDIRAPKQRESKAAQS